MGSPLPLEGTNPFTGMYQARQVGAGYINSWAPIHVSDYLASPPADMLTAEEQTPLVERAEFWGLKTQTVTVTGSPTGGTFQLQYGVNWTSSLAYNASAAAVQNALNALSSLSGSSTNEVQTVTVTGSPTGGTFTLTYAGQTTAAIAYNASNTTVRTSLEALSTIGTGNVAVTGPNGGPYVVTFQGALADQNVAQMTASGASLTGGTSPGVTVATTTGGTSALTVAGSAGGPYTVTFGSNFNNKPIQLLRTRQVLLTGGTKPNVVVTSTAQQAGFIPF